VKFPYVLIALVVAIGVVLAIAGTRPARFRVERSATIHAPVETVYGLIADFHNWPRWVPQDREDASMRRRFSGAASGVGAQSDWQSTGSAGAGKMEIVEATPGSLVRVRADWMRPFKTTNVNTFELAAQGADTQVTWTMEGPNLFPMRVMSVFVNMDKMMGKHFEDGLGNLKAAAEKR
jgi:uncharacterized protein YndB with AHSA1/START domain